MALTHSTAARDAMANSITATVDTGGGTSKVQIATSSAFSTILAEFPLSSTAFGASSSGVITLAGTPITDASAANTGTATYGRIIDRTATQVLQGTCGTSGTDFIIDNTSIVTGQEVILNSLTWTAPT